MIKYICDICNSEIQSSGTSELIGLSLGTLDFTNEVIHLCSTCYPKFNPAKSIEYANFSSRYNALNQEYKQAIITDITTNVDPEPDWEDTEFTFENNP